MNAIISTAISFGCGIVIGALLMRKVYIRILDGINKDLAGIFSNNK